MLAGAAQVESGWESNQEMLDEEEHAVLEQARRIREDLKRQAAQKRKATAD